MQLETAMFYNVLELLKYRDIMNNLIQGTAIIEGDATEDQIIEVVAEEMSDLRINIQHLLDASEYRDMMTQDYD